MKNTPAPHPPTHDITVYFLAQMDIRAFPPVIVHASIYSESRPTCAFEEELFVEVDRWRGEGRYFGDAVKDYLLCLQKYRPNLYALYVQYNPQDLESHMAALPHVTVRRTWAEQARALYEGLVEAAR